MTPRTDDLPHVDPPDLVDDVVHVWHFSLAVAEPQYRALRNLLTPEECVRADRFYREVHQRRFVAGRGVLRLILSRYTGIAPEAVRFQYGPHGKPALEPRAETAFNLSHSGEKALCAVALTADLGVDLEACGENREFHKVARRFFAAAEYEQLAALPAADQLAAFYQCWSAKEALIKAWGLGLNAPLQDFVVRVAPYSTGLHSVALVGIRERPWRLRALPAPAGHTAALAYDGAERRVLRGRISVSVLGQLQFTPLEDALDSR